MLATWSLYCLYLTGVVAGRPPYRRSPSSIQYHCQRITLGGEGKTGKTTLSAHCVDGEGEPWVTSINLNKCIGSEGGVLKYMDQGNFDSKCRPCILDLHNDPHLQCSCWNGKSGKQFTSLQLGGDGSNMTVRTSDGAFICGDHIGTKIPV